MMATSENWLSRRKGKFSQDLFKLDIKNKTAEENIIEILQCLYLKKPLINYDVSPTYKNALTDIRSVAGFRNMQKNGTDNRRLSYLNALLTLICREERSKLGFSVDELMACIRISLVDESMVIRATALRVLRYLIKTESDVAVFNNLKLSYLVTRSMDLMLRNEDERAQALRVVRRIIAVVGSAEKRPIRHRAAYLDKGLLRCIVAVARAGSANDGSGDRLSRPAVATLSEICVLNPELFIACGGVTAVIRQLAECATPRMAEALCGVLLHTLNDPDSRQAARIDLTFLSSPYCDFHFRPATTDSTRDEREMRFTCCRLALVCVLRSWTGVMHFCDAFRPGGLKALVGALQLPRLEVRKAILDLLYELVGLPQPEWTDEISVALGAVDPSDFQDSWRLNEGFVAAEGTSILPHLCATGPDITEIHLALLLQCFLEAGLLDGLADVIVTSDTFISVRATVLLGQLLHLIHLLLPPQIFSITPALPSLMSQASEGKPKALSAIAALRRLHSMLEARPASNSLFLDHIIQYCSGAFKEKTEDMSKSRKEKDNANMARPKDVSMYTDSIEFLDELGYDEPKQRRSVGSRVDVANRNVSALVKSKSVTSRTSAAVSKVSKTAKFFNLFERESDNLIRCTLVTQNKDGNTWNWEIVRTILKESESDPLLNLNDSGHRAWATRIVNYLKPSSNKYSHTDLTSTCHGHSPTRAGCQLIRHLLKRNDMDSQRLLEDLFNDISRQIEAIDTGRKAHECLFSPQHMCNTMCQMYFLFIGQLCHTQAGLRLFKQTMLYNNLLELSTKTHLSCYVKLVISSLDYTLDSYPRDILAKTLSCNIEASRRYATQFLNVLLRASQKSRELVRRKSKLKKNITQDHIRATQKDENDPSAGVDMETWILEMLVGQIKDESKTVVKCALEILEEAFSVPTIQEKLITLKDILGRNCRLDRDAEPSSLDFSASSDRGYLLWFSLEILSGAKSGDAKSLSFIKKHLDFWTKSYNYRYVGLVEARAQEAATLWCGGRAPTRCRRAALAPSHIHAVLARIVPQPISILPALRAVLLSHYQILQSKKCGSDQEIADLKASMWALGNNTVTPSGLQQVMSLSNGYLDDSVLVHIIKLAKYCPVYSLRATAFYVLGLIGSTFDGSNILSELGWLCVRHTRHDQFPVIYDEIQSVACDPNDSLQYLMSSLDHRYPNYDTEMSEHSDHTDQSVAESLQSDITKQSLKIIEQETDKDVVDHKILDARKDDKRKSHTLPIQGCSSSHDRPSLSESKTVDIIRDCTNFEKTHCRPENNRLLVGRISSLDHAHEGRVRNASESSTSGVSSCDSFLGKYTIPDRVLTLSPIPSSTSLYGMKSNNSSIRTRLESHRRISTSSFTAPDAVSSSSTTQLDMSGYATLMSLNRHRRPHLSESAASGSSDIDDISWLLSETNRRSKPFSSLRDRAKTTRERMAKLSLMEYDWKPLSVQESPRSGASSPASAIRLSSSNPPQRTSPPPTYMGICLPKDLADIFPSNEERKRLLQEVDSNQSRSLRVPCYMGDSIISSNEKCRITPEHKKISQKVVESSNSVVPMSTFKPIITGTAAGAVSTNTLTSNRATTAETNTSTTTTGVSSDISTTSTENIAPKTKKTDSAANSENGDRLNKNKSDDRSTIKKNRRKERDLTSSQAMSSESLNVEKTQRTLIAGEIANQNVGGNTSVSSSTPSKSVGANISRWRHLASDCLACVRTRPPSSHELREAFFADMDTLSLNTTDPEQNFEASSPQAELLMRVHFMSNPIHLRQNRSALLSLKQRHPEVFRSACVYSDVCALLARETYMLCARRFLQELFLDTNFECFSTEPAKILSRYMPTVVSPLNLETNQK